MSLAGAIADARKSATRIYALGKPSRADFLGKETQKVQGRLVEQRAVHLYDPINDHVNSELRQRTHEFSSSETISIWAGTFNLNGKGSGVKEDLSPWLCPPVGKKRSDYDIIAVGFQEIVELSPQQVMSTDPVRRQGWEEAVRSTINNQKRYSSREEYVLLRSGELVGAALIVFVKSSSLKKIKNVEGSVKKTGLSGMAGNKGAVAIRMDYANSRICLVTAHLAAGFANYEERNRDYRTISRGLRFQRNRTIDDHDAIIWLGDMNYRIGLSDDKVRRLIRMNDLESLYANDQLNLQMIAGRAFPFYSETRITFMPTYKYNNGTDEYDTSNVDEQRKEALSRALYEKRKHDLANPSANGEKTDEDLAGHNSIAAGLPPISSDRRKWWLDNGAAKNQWTIERWARLTSIPGLPARSHMRPPQNNMVLNPRRPSNPFSTTDEPDWVMVGPSKEGRGSAGRNSTLPLPPAHRGTRVTPSADRHTGLFSSALALASHSDAAASTGSASFLLPSTAPDLRRKAAPPVPKKPALLSTLSAGPDSPHKRTAVDSSNPPSATLLTNSRADVIFISPPSPLRRRTSTTTAGADLDLGSRISSTEMTSVSKRPPPSSVRQSSTVATGRGRGSDDSRRNLLDDVDDEGARHIPSLQPSRPGYNSSQKRSADFSPTNLPRSSSSTSSPKEEAQKHK
ncbi:MAG: hypothetical protein Q9184_003394 [Pyrenodesmia sp. 2 TL-2023]